MRLTYPIIEFVVYEIWEESEELSLLEHIMYFSLLRFPKYTAGKRTR